MAKKQKFLYALFGTSQDIVVCLLFWPVSPQPAVFFDSLHDIKQYLVVAFWQGLSYNNYSLVATGVNFGLKVGK